VNSYDAIIDFPLVAVVLPANTRGLVAALAVSRFVNGSNGLRVSMVSGDDSLTGITETFFVPLDRLQKPLKRAWCGTEHQSYRFAILSLNVGE
jgi:hypothetical protein